MMAGRVVGASAALTLVVALGLAVQGPACFITFTWWCIAFALGVLGYETGRRGDRDLALARAQDVATLERAEAVLTALDDEPPPLPPAIPMEMRDPAFQRREAEMERLKRMALAASVHAARLRVGVDRYRSPLMRRWDLQNEPLVADRSFTLLTHCQHGHVATHWLGRITTDHIERICRFERCAATWQERT